MLEHYYFLDRQSYGNYSSLNLGDNAGGLFQVQSQKRNLIPQRIGDKTRHVRFDLIIDDFYAGIEALMAFRRMKHSGGGNILNIAEYEAIMGEVANACRERAPYQDPEEHEKQHPGQPQLYHAITFVIDHKTNYSFITVAPEVKYAAIQHENPNYTHSTINPSGRVGEWKYIEKGLREKGPAVIRQWAKLLMDDAFKYAVTHRGRRLTKGEINTRIGSLFGKGTRGTHHAALQRMTYKLE
jgi:hypothetical protein